MSRRDLEHQIQDLLDGALADDEARALVARFREDPDALELYRQSAVVDSALTRLTAGKMALQDDTLSIAAIARKRSRFRTAELTWLAAAAIITITLVALRLIFLKEEPPVLTWRAAADTHFEIVPPNDGSPGPAPGALTVGSRLEISQGTMELTFASGVTSIVQAPVSLTLQAQDRIALDTGTAWFHVPVNARGFKVHTPELEITDLGTEFGVLASPHDADEVHVLRGTVHARISHHLRQEETLTTNQARRCDPAGRLQATPARPQQFLSSLPDRLPHLHFPLDAATDGLLAVEGNHPDVAEVAARLVSPHPARCFVPGVRGRALAFDGQGTCIETNWPGIGGQAPRSVAFWLRLPPGLEPAPSLPAMVGWGDPASGLNAKWKVLASRQNPDGQLLPRLSFGIERYDGVTPLDDGRWHHLAVVYTGRTLPSGLPEVTMFLDARREPLTRYTGPPGPPAPERPGEIRTLTHTSNAAPLCIGTGVVRQPATIQGELDELYLFAGAISPDTIQRLYETGPR